MSLSIRGFKLSRPLLDGLTSYTTIGLHLIESNDLDSLFFFKSGTKTPGLSGLLGWSETTDLFWARCRNKHGRMQHPGTVYQQNVIQQQFLLYLFLD